MDRLELHERIIATEYYLYGGVVDVPKIYDADTKHHSERYVKGSRVRATSRPRTTETRVVELIDFSKYDWSPSSTLAE